MSFLGQLPVATLRAYRGPRDTLDLMAQHALGPDGEQSILVRRFAEWVTGQVTPKCYLSEILAIRHLAVQPSPTMPWVPVLKYANDAAHVEQVKTPSRIVREINEHGFSVVDCDDVSTFLAALALTIGREVELVAMGFAPRSLSHVAVRVREPKSRQWILLDGVAGPREREAASKAVELMFKSLY